MKEENIQKLADTIREISKITETDTLDFIDAITGTAISEEDAGRIKEYCYNNNGIEGRKETAVVGDSLFVVTQGLNCRVFLNKDDAESFHFECRGSAPDWYDAILE